VGLHGIGAREEEQPRHGEVIACGTSIRRSMFCADHMLRAWPPSSNTTTPLHYLASLRAPPPSLSSTLAEHCLCHSGRPTSPLPWPAIPRMKKMSLDVSGLIKYSTNFGPRTHFRHRCSTPSNEMIFTTNSIINRRLKDYHQRFSKNQHGENSVAKTISVVVGPLNHSAVL
jgi:hypothetical protein